MMSFHFEIKSGGKGEAAEHARYITRDGRFRFRDDLVATGYGNMPPWAEYCPGRFWDAADKYERDNGATYREYTAALPNLLDDVQNERLALRLAEELVGDKPYQFAVHAPEAKIGGMPNPHLHLMYSDRTPDGIERPADRTFARYNAKHPEKGGRRKDSGGRNKMQLRDEVIAKRKQAAEIINASLEAAGFEERVDHRSYKERGIKKQPEKHLGAARVVRMSAAEKEAVRAKRIAVEVEAAPAAAPEHRRTGEEDKRLHDAWLPSAFGLWSPSPLG